MLWNRNKLFCDINPFCYAISLQKEICKRHMSDLLCRQQFAVIRKKEALPNVVAEHHSNIIKRAKGVDLTLQKNKAINIALACDKINGSIIRPGEVFSFWRAVGKPTKKRGYLNGRIIYKNKLIPGTGGGLCNLGNTIHLLVLHSPMNVTEFHRHSDALAPDEGERVPFSAGTSISYNNIDYRFKNNTNQDIQLLLWCEGEFLHAELRSDKEFPQRYELVEENHHFQKENNKYYRVSKIYRNVIDRATDIVTGKELVLDNHSEVMFDYSLIPKEQIKN